MSLAHKTYVLQNLDMGSGETSTLAAWGLDEAAVLAIPDNFTFDAEGSYCPMVDIPEFVRNAGVHYDVEPERAYIVINNRIYLAMFRLTRK